MWTQEKINFMWEIVQEEFPLALWDTLYVTFLSTFLAVVIGLPLGVILATGGKNGVLKIPGFIIAGLNVIINLLRSMPFLILMIVKCLFIYFIIC